MDLMSEVSYNFYQPGTPFFKKITFPGTETGEDMRKGRMLSKFLHL